MDVKSTVKDSGNNIKGMTLGTFQGYFRNRNSNIGESISYPYNDYSCHIVLGVIYSQVADKPNEKDVYSLAEIESIESVIKDFQFFAQPKYKIASAIKRQWKYQKYRVNEDNKWTNGWDKRIFPNWEKKFSMITGCILLMSKLKRKNIPRPYTNLKSYLEYKERVRIAPL